MNFIGVARDASVVAGRMFEEAKVVEGLVAREGWSGMTEEALRLARAGKALAQGSIQEALGGLTDLKIADSSLLRRVLHLPDGSVREVGSNLAGSVSREYTTNTELAMISRPSVGRMGGAPHATTETFDDTSSMGRAYVDNLPKTAFVVRVNRSGTSYSAGSGMTVRPDGMILGGHHSVSVPGVNDAIYMKIPGRPTVRGNIVAQDPPNDLVLIKPASPIAPVPFNHPSTFMTSVPNREGVLGLGVPDISLSVTLPHISGTPHLIRGRIISLDMVRHLKRPQSANVQDGDARSILWNVRRIGLLGNDRTLHRYDACST